MSDIWDRWQNVTVMTWPQLRDHVNAHKISSHLFWYLTGKRYTVWTEYGGVRFVAQFQRGHAHGKEWEASYLPYVRDKPQRIHSDGGAVVKLDPGNDDTTLRFYELKEDIAAAGDTTFVLDWALGKLLQGVARIKVKDGHEDDLLDLQIQSDGTVPAYGPIGTVLQPFGPIDTPDGAGWQEDGQPPLMDGVSTAMPLAGTGMRVAVVYTAVDSSPRKLKVRFQVHE